MTSFRERLIDEQANRSASGLEQTEIRNTSCPEGRDIVHKVERTALRSAELDWHLSKGKIALIKDEIFSLPERFLFWDGTGTMKE